MYSSKTFHSLKVLIDSKSCLKPSNHAYISCFSIPVNHLYITIFSFTKFYLNGIAELFGQNNSVIYGVCKENFDLFNRCHNRSMIVGKWFANLSLKHYDFLALILFCTQSFLPWLYWFDVVQNNPTTYAFPFNSIPFFPTFD